MRKIAKLVSLLAILLCGCAIRPPQAKAQFLGFTSPQTVQQITLNAASTPQTFLIQNLGQNVHFLTYTTAGTGVNNLTALDIRIEGSNDGTTFFPISDDAIDVLGGQVFAVGYYPVIRVNLLLFTIASGTPTITASYSGTSATTPLPLGISNPTQTSRRPIFFNQTVSANHSTATNIISPYGSTLGYIVLVTNSAGSFPGGSAMNLQLNFGGGAFQTPSFSIPSPQQSTTTWIPINALPASTIGIQYVSGGASALTFDAYYLFLSPSLPNELVSPGIQPPTTLNSETTSAVNTAITLNLAGSTAAPTQRVHLFSVSARCSAGTAGLTVKDGVAGTTIWTSAATEVGTTTFKYQWGPGLSSTLSAGMTISLTTCGGGNTGTLDVQASQF